MLVALTGGFYPAISLVSSNVFGLKITSSGLTQFELRELIKFKVINNVVLENVPQVILQSIYSFIIGEFTETVGLAMFASLLSIIASILDFCIKRDHEGMVAVQYYLGIRCVRGSSLLSMKDDADEGDELQHETRPHCRVPDASPAAKSSPKPKKVKAAQITQIPTKMSEGPVNALSNDEKKHFKHNRGRTRALAESVAALYAIPSKSIEIGATVMSQTGAMVHVIHFVYQRDIDLMQSQRDEYDPEILGRLHTERRFASLKCEFTETVRAHFGLSDDFEVEYHDNPGGNRDDMGGIVLSLESNMRRYLENDGNVFTIKRDRLISMTRDLLNETDPDHKAEPVDRKMNVSPGFRRSIEVEMVDLVSAERRESLDSGVSSNDGEQESDDDDGDDLNAEKEERERGRQPEDEPEFEESSHRDDAFDDDKKEFQD